MKKFLQNILRKTIIVSALLIITAVAMDNSLIAQRLSRDQNVELLINQVGYVPQAGKMFVTKGIRNSKFDLIDLRTQKVVFTGDIKPNPGDFGEYSTGDFSSFTQEGNYYLKSDTLRSYPFAISKSVYQSPIDLIVGYFSLQRCGASTTGFLSPCHLDDGIRLDNGKHQDVTGGWHDASDLRKWVGATIYGMLGLGKTYDLLDPKSKSREKILDELKWGNTYFLKMQEPDGFVMSFIGGGVKENADNNRWSNSEIGPDGGEVAIIKPNTGITHANLYIFGKNDDRVIQTKPLDMLGQFNFITSEAMMARFTKAKESAYSKKCKEAAVRCFDWCVKSNKSLSPGVIGASIQASIEMFKTTKEEKYMSYAVQQASELKKLQAAKQEGNVGGFFYTSPTDKEPYKNVSRGCLEFISICDLIYEFPKHKDVPVWKEMITDYANQYVMFMSQKNSFGIVPFGLFSKEDPGGNRKTGNYWYQYFMNPTLSWWVGINCNLASAGVGLMKAADILNDPALKSAAQKQLDWIVGVNPFNSSTIVSVGYNQPKQFINSSEFRPETPLIPGAIMNGLGGDISDQPSIGHGNYNISEYWTPMVAYTIWLMAEISK